MKKGLFISIFMLAVTYVGVLLTGNGAIAAEPIVIGIASSLGLGTGQQSMDAVKMVVEEINSRGGITVGSSKRPLKVETVDLRDAEPGVPVTEALLGMEKLIIGKKAYAILVGPYRSEALLASMDLIAKHKVLMLLSIAMTPEMENKIQKDYENYKYVFRLCINSKNFMEYMAGLYTYIGSEFKFKRVYVLNEDSGFSRAAVNPLITNYFEKPDSGWTVMGHRTFPIGATDYTTGLMDAQMKGAQALLMLTSMPQGINLVKQWKSMKISALMAGYTGLLTTEEAWKELGGGFGGAMDLIMEMGNGIGVKEIPRSLEFLDRYVKRYGPWPKGGAMPHGIAPAYESMYILQEAIEKAGTLDPDAVVKEIEKTDRMGAMGRIRFDKNHQVVYGMDPQKASVAVVIQWRDDGQRVIVFPESIAKGKIELPAGLKTGR